MLLPEQPILNGQPSKAPQQDDPSTRVGIWIPSARNNQSFVRDQSKRAEWLLWADVREIPAKSTRKRIVLLGESVARGAFYDPCYTVAGELEGTLQVAGMEDAEVIDLAKTGMFIHEWPALIKACKLLQPDAVVILGGNNLVFTMQGGEDHYQEMYERYRQEGFAGVKAFGENELRKTMTAILEEIQASLVQAGIPVIYVVPEFNLRDWKSNTHEQVVPWLEDDQAAQWKEARDIALNTGSTREPEAVRLAAERMIIIDPSNPLGYEILGVHYSEAQEWDKARTYYEQARDTAFMNRGIVSKPRCFKVIQDTIRTTAPGYGIRVVNLPAVFSSHLDGLPDRRLFLDYCHLTVTGIKLAMRYTAAALIERLIGTTINVDLIGDSGIWPDNTVQAVAHACAAIHNAHYGQTADILAWHCDKAVAWSANVKDLMARFADFSTRSTSSLFCQSFEELITESETQQSRSIFSLVHPRGQKLMDIELVDYIVQSLNTIHIAIGDSIRKIRMEDHVVGPQKKNLLTSFYTDTYYSDHLPGLQSAYFRSYQATSSFCFIAQKGTLGFEWVYRTPAAKQGEKKLTISINNRPIPVADFPSSPTWSKGVFVIEEDWLTEGVNKLLINWPTPDAPVKEVAGAPATGFFEAVFPVNGEISSFTAVVTVKNSIMTHRPSSSLKSVAGSLAALMMSKSTDQQQKLALLEQLAIEKTNTPDVKDTGSQARKQENNPVGIWKPSLTNDKLVYTRDMARRPEWPLWANVHEIKPKGKKKRILLLGESVARGYFYDPYYTVAMELEATMNKVSGIHPVEVIDLARTSMNLPGLINMIKACTVLQPDAVVVFAGNNWRTDISLTADAMFKQVYEIYKKEFFTGTLSFLEESLKERVLECLDTLRESLIKKSIPVLFLIPGFNLKDWRSNAVEQMLPWLPGDRIGQWLHWKEVGEQALQDSDLQTLESAALQMTVLDPSNPLGHEWLGQCYDRKGLLEQARASFGAARDTALMSREDSKPRCYGVIQQTLVVEAANYGIKLINLPVIFETEQGKLEDRDLYLDYCHLTVTGIKIAARYAAQALAEMMEGLKLRIENVPPSGLQPTAGVMATAHFCAAIHNAHSGQHPDIIQYHCNKAVTLDPNVKELMVRYADFSTRKALTLLCSAFEELILEGEMRQYEGGLGLAHPRGRKLMDIDLVDQIIQSVNSPLANTINEIRLSEHGVSQGKKNLLESFYSATFYHNPVPKPGAVFLQARSTETRFQFVADRDHIDLSMVYRTPQRNYPNKKIRICLNNKNTVIAEIPMADKWTSYSFSIADTRLKKGVNHLIIDWPYTSEPQFTEQTASGHSMFRAMFPVLGEIAVFTAIANEKSTAFAKNQDSLMSLEEN
ncbi:SGNH/GDSL hydrolase family protein [Paraflavitalea soli]|nr:hypothetical protein [Paraflavitalea soli]